MALTGVHADYAGNRHTNGPCGFSPLSVRGVTRCMCKGYPATTIQGDCTVCGGGYYECMADYEADIPPVNSGRVVGDMPVTVSVFLGTHGTTKEREYVKIANVREDSITLEERNGIQTLVCESAVTTRLAYVPNAVWYMTETQTGIVE